jgi:RimJ/RimL family protein N-acetyltransferase
MRIGTGRRGLAAAVDTQRFVLETERLRLRPMSLDDLDFVAEMLAHPEVMRFYPKCHTRSESAEWIERQLARYEKDGHGLWLALERQSGVPVGQIGLTIQQVDGCPEPALPGGGPPHRNATGSAHAARRLRAHRLRDDFARRASRAEVDDDTLMSHALCAMQLGMMGARVAGVASALAGSR